MTPDGSLFKFKALLGLLRRITHTHTGDNGITSFVRRVTALDSDERGMRRNTFSFPLRRKLQGGEGGFAWNQRSVSGEHRRARWKRERKKDDDVIG